MRISDWSSDVCSSDLGRILGSQADWPNLQGPHNAQNAAAAVAACRALGLPDAAIASALRGYRGLPHRMERVKEKGGILFVNDSKATNPTSAAPALGAYPAIHRSEEHTSELQSLMRISYAVYCLQKKKHPT